MRTSRLVIAAAVGLALVTAGCSSSSSAPKAAGTTPPASTAPSTTSTPTPRPTPTPTNSTRLDPQLSKMLLGANQVAAVGTPVVERLFKGGNQVAGQVTLDACNAHFASESKRVARIQVGYIAVTGPLAGRQVVSNEVVRYAPGGTVAAFNELRHVARNCPARVRFGKTEIQTNFTVQPTRRDLGARQLTVSSLLHVQGQKVWSVASYLYNGDLFDGVYLFGATKAATLRADRQLARLAYQRLTSAAVAGGLSV